ncbi:hypothetical protein LEM8419_00002 [Neolewinella maritima]|uniref:Uncharacterized protein n=1 Tax=Neolewinella maritima TaxID=1383882 RepID=A0ABM9AVJ9_9BACT|nr:hypothetical protein [Neolewinella maritima]CAH0998657.1 hypothetical protein LEM8419_00002 [Neolewinella maritima]
MVLDKPLNNGQLELMKMFSHELSEADLLKLRRMLAAFFADRASDAMDELWENKSWSDETMDAWLTDSASGKQT